MLHRYAKVGGLTTHYLEAGDGPPLVLLHGGEFGAAAEVTWEHVIPALATRYRVIAPDFYGYGHSDKVRDFTGQRRRYFEQISGLLDTLRIPAAAFVGTSLSGRLVLDAARRRPPTWPVRAIVAVGVGLTPPEGPENQALAGYDGTLDGLRPLMPLLFADPAFADDEAYLRRRYEFCAIPGAWEFGAASRLRRPETTPAAPRREPPSYASVAVPTCLVRGAEDRLVPRAAWQDLAAQIPGAAAHLVDGAGHYPQIERPDTFTKIVSDFLAGLDT